MAEEATTHDTTAEATPAAEPLSSGAKPGGVSGNSSDRTSGGVPATISSRRASHAPRSGFQAPGWGHFKFLMASFALMLSLAAGFLGGWLGASGHDNANSLNGSSTVSQQRVVASESQLISSIAKTVGPSVVSVDVISQADHYIDGIGPQIGRPEARPDGKNPPFTEENNQQWQPDTDAEAGQHKNGYRQSRPERNMQ